VPATARASFYVYNDEQDVDALVRAVRHAQALFGERAPSTDALAAGPGAR
jgi:hypothetical protein